jgi:glycopeptide antibiotics resistance protein
MQLKSISKRAVIIGTLFIWAVKFGIRPYWHGGQPVKYLLGVMPNLLGSFLIPFGAYWFFEQLFRFRNMYHLRFVCVFGFLLLVINETLQLIPLFGRTFDLNDIACSGIGLLLSYIVFGRLYWRELYQYSGKTA